MKYFLQKLSELTLLELNHQKNQEQLKFQELNLSNKYILAIETSSSICGVAVIHNKEILSVEEKDESRKHAELLPDLTKSSLRNIDKTLDDIDAIAISIGPGSFTGLRIGLGFSKGIAYAKNLPIIPVPSMLSLAFSLRKYEPKQGILHSHANKIFFQTFRWENNIPSPNEEPTVGDIDDYFQVLSHGFHYNCENLLTNLKRLRHANPSSSNVGQLASIYFEDLVIYQPHSLIPSYIAPFKTGT